MFKEMKLVKICLHGIFLMNIQFLIHFMFQYEFFYALHIKIRINILIKMHKIS